MVPCQSKKTMKSCPLSSDVKIVGYFLAAKKGKGESDGSDPNGSGSLSCSFIFSYFESMFYKFLWRRHIRQLMYRLGAELQLSDHKSFHLSISASA